ncbi:MAG TPA: hypothetical protein VGG62_01140 [Terracidiphilus sp.]|jgi:hypothetical protein
MLITSEAMEGGPKLKAVRTIGQLFETIGGKHALCEVTGSSYTAVCNWLALYKRIPARKYLLVQNHLKRNGYIADPRLFDMD